MPIPGNISPLDLMTTTRATAVREALVVAGAGWVGQTFDLMAAGGAATAPTSQSIHATAIGLQAGQVVNNILVANTLAASGTLTSGITVGIATPDGVVRTKSTADFTALASNPAGVITYALPTGYVVPNSGLFYVFFLQNGVFGTNQPTFCKGNVPIVAGQNLFGVFGTGQTSIPAVGSSLGTFSAATGPPFWYGVS